MLRKTTPRRWTGRARRAAVVLALLVVAAACGDSSEPAPTAATAAPTTERSGVTSTVPIPDEPGGGVEPGVGVEPGTGTEVTLAPPATAPTGRSLAIPLSVAAGAGDTPWDEARLDVIVDGPVAADATVDLGTLAPGGSVRGILLVDVEPGVRDTLSRATVTVDLLLYDGGDLVNARRSQLALVADTDTVYLGLGSVGDLERARLDALLAAGRITQAEYDAAYAATLEKITG